MPNLAPDLARLIMPRILSLVILISALPSFKGQLVGQSHTDSLLQVATASETLQAAEAYKELAKLSSDSFELHLFYANEGLKLATQLGERLLRANILMNLGVLYDRHAEFDKAIAYYDSTKSILTNLNDVDTWWVSLHINYGAAYYFAGHLNLGLEHFLKAYEYSEGDHGFTNYGYILNNIGVIYQTLDKPKDAIKYFKESIKYKESVKDSFGLFNSKRNLADLYHKIGELDTALLLAKDALQGFQSLNQTLDSELTQYHIAKYYLALGETARARSIAKAIPIDLAPSQMISKSIEKLIIKGDIEFASEAPLSAKNSFLAAKKVMDENAFLVYEQEVMNKLSECEAKLGNFQKAYQNLKEINTKIIEKTAKDRMALEQEMQVKFNMISQERQNAFLQSQNELKDLRIQKSNRTLGFLFVILISVITFAVQTFRNRRHIIRLNKTLQDQKSTISKTLAERETLLQEIHHRVKNNLQFISSLLSLQSEHVSDEMALDALQGGQDRVQSMALIHQNLYQDNNLTGINVKIYFEKLSQNLFDSYNIAPSRIKLNLNIDEVNLDVDSVVPLGLIVNELISNALKHAFPQGRNGIINVSLLEADDELILEVRDNGIGMKDSEEQVLGSSFGYRLVHAFKEQLDANVKIDGEKGTTIKLHIRGYRKAA